MSRRLALAAALSLATFGCAQAEFVEKPFAPETGSRWTIEDVQDAVSVAADGTRTTQTIKQTSEIVFEEKLSAGWRVSFAQKNVSVSGDAPAVAIVGPAIESMKGVVISASLDERGKPISVINLDETRAGMKTIVEKTSEAFADKPQVASTVRSMMTGLLLLEGTQAAEAYLEPLELMAGAQNTGLKPGEDRRATLRKPNPFGGEPLKSVATTRIAEPDPDGVTIVTRTEAYDAESLKQATAALGRKLLAGAGSEARISQADLDRLMPMITMSYDSLAVFDVDGGMTREISQSQQIRVSAMGKSFSKDEKRRMTITRAP